ncbi:sugar O-acyltransferase (sialic acid O-acetyltransferase NeuD family) [Peribacillus deserti]|uniref:Sugar O-acyltransferase (Sialic acid O-acetyltransferase NeuD family) n=1 Tax=Peribacillus deserti TaxID=673318 RepID=A0ABS2QEN9_9BACI|nr:acetyltransferase [Peribacillus deserti]MBM7690776.1 sugar O-acyltransferase (sialic acid O-acetyltransferase NeuD family) [Peribacillus deserti]
MKEKLLIIGASGHGKVVADIALKMKKWKTITFLDDNFSMQLSMGIQVSGKTVDAFTHINDCDIFVGVGNNATREQIQLKLEAEGASIPTLIHPSAVIGEQVELASGTVVMAGVVINCCTRVGKGCIINTGATIDHDNLIEDYVHVSPGSHLAGTVKVGLGSWLGIGSVVSNNINITSKCIVGAGAVVVRDIMVAGVYVGIPAKKI